MFLLVCTPALNVKHYSIPHGQFSTSNMYNGSPSYHHHPIWQQLSANSCSSGKTARYLDIGPIDRRATTCVPCTCFLAFERVLVCVGWPTRSSANRLVVRAPAAPLHPSSPCCNTCNSANSSSFRALGASIGSSYDPLTDCVYGDFRNSLWNRRHHHFVACSVAFLGTWYALLLHHPRPVPLLARRVLMNRFLNSWPP